MTEKWDLDTDTRLAVRIERATNNALHDRIMQLEATNAQLVEALKHILVMKDDAYLVGHPEWNAIVDEAQAAIALAKEPRS